MPLESLDGQLVDICGTTRRLLAENPGEIAAAFAQSRSQGKVREFGVSNFRPSQFAALQKACAMPLVVNQVEVSLAALACLDELRKPGCHDRLAARGGRLMQGLQRMLDDAGIPARRSCWALRK